jgi:diaminopimelate epimerase
MAHKVKLPFVKMQGLGNDFVVLDGVRQTISLSPEQLRFLADRHFGVGCDQILLVEPASQPDVDFRYRIFNADGGEVEQCGNGARCFVRFVHDQGLTAKQEIRVETQKGIIAPRLAANGLVCVDMGAPRLKAGEIPFDAAAAGADSTAVIHPLTLADGTGVEVSVVSMGNPHAVLVVPDVDTAPVASWGAELETHPRFPARVNVGFLQVVDRQSVRLRVFERGAGETLACGTGACAAVVAGIRRGLLDSPVRVETRGGALSIAWAGPDSPVLMTGPAVSVFSGEIELPA